MMAVNFVFWLQGFFELSDEKTITEHQIDCIKKHLNMVFVHEIDPSYGKQDHQDVLNEIHNSLKPPAFPPSQTSVHGGGLIRC